ncbi:hypothetical protein [Flavonifractor plautii]|uniref:hypothetical protein n=1 Tax=Flavonifractor plautii TaxID=292800 RepID=UPI00189B91AB|nr:hypothetical protein [Flavonifractor plautii]
MEHVCGSIRYNGEATPVKVDDEGSVFFIDPTSNTEVYIEGEVPSNPLRFTKDVEFEQADLIASAMSDGGDKALGIVLGDTVAGIRFADAGSYECVVVKELSPQMEEMVAKFPSAPVDALATLYFRAKLHAGSGKVAAWAKAFMGTECAAKKYDRTDYADLLKVCDVDAGWLREFATR